MFLDFTIDNWAREDLFHAMSVTVGLLVTSGRSSGRNKETSDIQLKNPLEGYRRLSFMMRDCGRCGGGGK